MAMTFSGFPLVDDLRALAWRVVDILLPPRCLRCGGLTDSTGALCPACWKQMRFLAPPLCECCGRPFDIDPGPGAICGACMLKRPPFDRARAVFCYDDASKALVLRFKHADRVGAAVPYARWMARAGAELLTEADVIVPVPLHRWRLLQRRYNQAALLANALGRLSGVPAVPDALLRVRHTTSQGHLGRKERRRNVRGAFQMARLGSVAGRRVLLIDDVLTSGATIEECVRVLRADGAAAVDVLTLACVVLGHD
ncbi:MAG TPA: ComF family protein [Patescibacteria group bacterium]|nr:ComF family protein [Patescibacteria group bacterium]